jgi:hypothetical protein
MIPRIAVIGPHRRRTGTGPFVAAFLRESGCEVLSWGRTEAGVLLESGRPLPGIDAVAICSPPETHLEYLQAAVARGLQVFCEKPIVWPADQNPAALDGLIAGLSRALDEAAAKDLTVHENTQWVYTLPDFRRIWGGVAPEEVAHFRCEMSPSSANPTEMTMESSAHGNSLLIALGCSGVEDLSVRFEPADAARQASLEFGFRSRTPSGGAVHVEYRFAQQVSQPRHAAYEVNHLRVERRVEVNGYRIFLRFNSQEQPIRDPLRSSVEDFLGKIYGSVSRGDDYGRILRNIQMSYSLMKALPGAPHA